MMVPLVCFSICAPLSLVIGVLCGSPTWLLPYRWINIWRNRLLLRVICGVLAFVAAYLIYSRISAELIWRDHPREYINEAWLREIIPPVLHPSCFTQEEVVCAAFISNPFPDVTLVLWNLVMSVFSGGVAAFTSRGIARHRMGRSL